MHAIRIFIYLQMCVYRNHLHDWGNCESERSLLLVRRSQLHNLQRITCFSFTTKEYNIPLYLVIIINNYRHYKNIINLLKSCQLATKIIIVFKFEALKTLSRIKMQQSNKIFLDF